MSNSFRGNRARCRICGFSWPATYQEAQEQECQRCSKILETRNPYFLEWLSGVIDQAIENHEEYRH